MAAVDALLSNVIDLLRSAQREIKLAGCLTEGFGVRTSCIQYTLAVLTDVNESWQLQHPTARLWLDRLKRVTYDIDDVLDDWNYAVISRKVRSSGLPCDFLTCWICCFRFPIQRSIFVHKMDTLMRRLINIVSDKDKYVSSSEPRTLEIAKADIFGPVWSSYNDLPSSLKLCFLYCVMFPKSYRMSKDELISLWMAHGFLKPTKDRDRKMVGDDYFRILGLRSILKDYEVEEKFNKLDKTYCKMHDELHDFAEFLMGKECLCLDVKSAEEVTSSVDAGFNGGVYHLYLKLGEKVEFPESFYKLWRLRSLIVSSSNYNSLIEGALPALFKRLTCLRSLSLSRCGLKNIPSNINKLIHLRWLKLSKNHALKELPETICELYYLQTISVNWCDGLVRFPKGVKKLINLMHLKNDYTYFLLPKGIGSLTGLRKLPRITIDPKSKDAFSLRDLKSLNNISGSLTIFFMERKRHALVEEAKQARLEEKQHITSLSLNFPERAAEEWMQQEDEEVVEVLKPPPSLEMLRITCYKGATCSSWFNTLTCLKKLKLWYWGYCEHLPALAKLPCLEYIEFCNFASVRKVTAEFLRMDDFIGPSSSTAPLFPKLANLQFLNMLEWEEWSDYEGDEDVMPCLSYLSIENCPKLKALPNFILEKDSLQKQIS